MKYLIMLYASQQDYDVMAGKPVPGKQPMSAEDMAAMHEHMETYHQRLVESGELVNAQGLAAPARARRVQLRASAPVITDGPYPESKEVLAGFTIVECDSIDLATEIAAGLIDPNTPGDYVDVRPVLGGVEELSG